MKSRRPDDAAYLAKVHLSFWLVLAVAWGLARLWLGRKAASIPRFFPSWSTDDNIENSGETLKFGSKSIRLSTGTKIAALVRPLLVPSRLSSRSSTCGVLRFSLPQIPAYQEYPSSTFAPPTPLPMFSTVSATAMRWRYFTFLYPNCRGIFRRTGAPCLIGSSGPFMP